MKKTLLFLMLLVASLTSFSQTVEVDGIYYYVDKYDLTCSVQGSTKYTGKLVIPEQVTVVGKVFKVTYVNLQGSSNIISVVIPNSVTGFCFSDCKRLTSVTIPNSVTKISNQAFANCSSLTSVTIPNSITEIGQYAFDRCSSLTSVNIPSSVKRIQTRAFSDCSSLTSITIPNSVTEIESHAFSDCKSLKSVTLSNSIRWIQDDTFYKCISLESITIPKDVTEIGQAAFYECNNLKEIHCLAINPPEFLDLSFIGVNKFCIVKVPEKSIPAYKNSSWDIFWDILPLSDKQ